MRPFLVYVCVCVCVCVGGGGGGGGGHFSIKHNICCQYNVSNRVAFIALFLVAPCLDEFC